MSKKQFMENLSKAIDSGDEGRIAALFDPNFIMYEDGGMPYGGVFHGPSGFRKVQTTVYETWRDHTIDPVTILEEPDGDRICLVIRFTGKPGKTDEVVETYVNEIWTVRDGKAVEARVWYWDSDRLSKIMTR